MQQYKLEGHIDHSRDGLVFGWVRNLEAPEERLWVELTLSSGWKAKVLANRLRQDLLDKGIGDGQYGFSVTVPFEQFGTETVTVRATVMDGSFALLKSGNVLTPEYPILLVAGDIVNNCNLRCPFCVTDYSLTKGSKLMPVETFKRALPLLELVPDGMFWLSCMHEATVHPNLLDFLDLVPKHLRRKVSFTTNFCRKMDDEYLRCLAASNIQSFRISIDSLDAEVFATLRKGGRLEVFWDNLVRFSRFLKETASVSEVHFVTMAFSINAHEIGELVRRCREALVPARHEVRFMFYVPHASEWGESRIMGLQEWNDLKETVLSQKDLGWVDFYDPEQNAHQKFLEKPGLKEYVAQPAVFGGLATPESYVAVDPREVGVILKDEPLRLRLRWDGLMMMETVAEDGFRQNILDVDADYFLQLRNSARKSDVVWSRI